MIPSKVYIYFGDMGVVREYIGRTVLSKAVVW